MSLLFQVYDTDGTTMRDIGAPQVYCGHDTPASFTSQGSHVRLLFSTDYSVADQGFEIQYEINTDSTGGYR